MTKQEVYDKVCAHLAQQKERAMGSLDGKPICLYRTDDGKACAIGCLLPDDVARKWNGYNSASDLVAMDGNALKYLELEDVPTFDLETFYNQIQNAHDRSETAEELRVSLINICDRNKITPGAEQAITKWK